MEKNNFENDLNEMKELYCGTNIQNQEIIQSHCLEILISFSQDQKLTEYFEKNPQFLKKILNTIEHENIKLALKALIFLVNITSYESISIQLQQQNIIGRLVSQIFTIMKQIKNNHVQIKVSMLDKDSKEEKEYEIFYLNEQKVKIDEAFLIIEIDRIKFIILILNNLLTFSNKAQDDLLQKNSDESDQYWMKDSNLEELMEEFQRVVMVLSSNEENRVLLLKNCFSQINDIFNLKVKSNKIKSALVFIQIIRNLSFEESNQKILDEFKNQKFYLSFKNILTSEHFENQKENFASNFVDIMTVLLTSKNFDEFQGKEILINDEFLNLIKLIGKIKLSKAEINDRFEALQVILQGELDRQDQEKIQKEENQLNELDQQIFN